VQQFVIDKLYAFPTSICRCFATAPEFRDPCPRLTRSVLAAPLLPAIEG
jgi:hypothetical protein